jgi:hypothetical protein
MFPREVAATYTIRTYEWQRGSVQKPSIARFQPAQTASKLAVRPLLYSLAVSDFSACLS